jgi:hypothetical protein
VVNTSPHTYLFAHLRLEEGGIRTHLAMAPDPAYKDVYGAFKGLGQVYRAHKALLRLLWVAHHECRNGFELPSRFTNRRKLDHHLFPLPEGMAARERLQLYRGLRRLFNGTSRAVLAGLVERLLEREDLAEFLRELIQADLEEVLGFYERCARRNRRLKRELGFGDDLVPQDALDDLLVLGKSR